MKVRPVIKRNFILTWAIIGSLIGVYYLYESYQNKKIANDRYETIGEIVGYSVVFPESYYIKYKYKVDGKMYVNETSTNVVFTDCIKTKECLGRKFVVFCEKNNPGNSIIDLKHEIK